MKNPFRHDRAFRIVFVFLVTIAAFVLAWQCSRQPPGPSRIDWPTADAGTKRP